MNVAVLVLALLVSGCTNIAWEIQQPNPAVKPVLKGRDCVDTYFGFGSGTATYAKAMRKTVRIEDLFDPYRDQDGVPPIRTIHSARVSVEQFWMFGTYCLRLTGEP